MKPWGTSASDTSVDYAAGASYTANKSIISKSKFRAWSRDQALLYYVNKFPKGGM